MTKYLGDETITKITLFSPDGKTRRQTDNVRFDIGMISGFMENGWTAIDQDGNEVVKEPIEIKRSVKRRRISMKL